MYAMVLDAALVVHAHEPACVEVRSAARRLTFAAFGFACAWQRCVGGSAPQAAELQAALVCLVRMATAFPELTAGLVRAVHTHTHPQTHTHKT